MIPGHYERVKEIFLRVADLPEEDRRAALRAACGTNASLRAEVEDLLALDSEPFSGSEDTGDKITHTIGTLNPQARIGPYLIGDELGSGGMGKVYRAEVVGKAPGLAAGTTVALKIIHPHLLEKAGFFKRFLREAEIGKSVRHPNVVRCIDCDAIVHEGRQLNFLVMEYVEGQTLRSLLQELDRVPEELCRHLGREIARGLAAIHAAGVVHRDLKPDNILITADHAVKVMDLGVARPTEQTARLSQTGSFIGTVEYAAPEQFRSDGPEIDGRADLYALGIILYELSTARHPYRDGDPRVVLRRVLEEPPRRVGQLNPQLSPFFEEVVQKLIAKDKEDRFASATDLIHVLEDGDKSEWWNARAQAIRIETKRPLRRVRMPRETAIYGREDDLARLRVIFADVKAAHGQVLLVEGEAGIGKTRLIDEFIGELDSAGEDLNFLFGSYPPGGAATVSGAWSTAYREQFGSEGLEERIRGYLSLTPSLASAFAALLKGEPTPEGKEPLTKDSMQTAFVQATRALAAERPTVVLIEDLHFAPEEGRAMFASLALAIPEDRVLLIGTSRPGVPESWRASIERLEHARSMALSRLGPKDLTRLLVDAFRSESLAEELAYKIAAKSDGNPFFAFEIVRDLREGQYLRMLPDGTWVISKKIQKIEIPSSVLDLVKARVSSLSEQERDLLDTASCCGFSFDPLLVAEATGLPTLAVLKLLSQIERHHRLGRSSGSNYVFDHHQVQEALYGSLSQPLRQAYHASIGEALEIRGSEDVTAVCEHFLKGGRGERALPHLEPALRRLEQSFSSERALDLIEMALGCRGG
ncbi:MAG: protein kinase, partial [Candidatus Eisenbacteria bacterium]|nr:protein kinase [Candidatus Eisenbacteria bacterium]